MFAQRLRKIRKDKGISQTKLAKLINVSKTTISAWENSKHLPSTESLIRICKALNISADYLFNNKYKCTINTENLSSNAILCLQTMIELMKYSKS